MKNTKPRIVFVISTILLSFVHVSLYAQDLNGVYTIGTSGTADYTTITDAVNELKAGNVIGDITYSIEPGTYNETLDLSTIANGDYTITFKGIDKETTIIHPLDSIVSSKSGILIDGMQNFTFRDFTLEMDDISDTKVAYNANETRGIAVTGSHDLQFINLSFTSSLFGGTGTEFVASSLSLIDVQNINIDSCAFSGAAMHLWLEEFNQVDITSNVFDQAYYDIYNLELGGAMASSDLLIAENDFNDPYTAIFLVGDKTNQDNFTTGVIIRDNTIEVTGSINGQIAVELLSLNGPVISGNTIIGGYHGLNDEGCLNSLYESNEIRVGKIALQLYESINPLAINNILYSQSSLVTDIEKASDVSLINNTFHREEPGENVVRIDLLSGTPIIINNIFSGNGITEGLLLFAGNNFDNLIINNNLYEPTAAFAFDIGNLNYIGTDLIPFGDYSLAEWQTLTSLDGNSQSFTPAFASTSDLHITNASDYRFGVYRAEVSTDIDGELRLESVGIDVGADQFCISQEVTLEVSACSTYTFNGTELTESGQYHAELVASNGCDSLVTLNLTIDPFDPSCEEVITGLAKGENSFLQVGPNPTSGNFTLQLNTLESNFSIEVYNLQGELISSNEYQSTDSVIGQLEGPAGLYLIKYSSASRSETLRIVKK